MSQKHYQPHLYFAYGSNLNLVQLLGRCPSAAVVCPHALYGWKLVFRGVADIVPGKKTDKVYGALYRITQHCEIALDRYEGYPHSYVKKRVDSPHGRIMFYIMNKTNRIGTPSVRYFNIVAEGFQNWGLPTDSLTDAVLHAQGIEEQAVKLSPYSSEDVWLFDQQPAARRDWTTRVYGSRKAGRE